MATNAADATGLLGWRHILIGDIGTDILPAMGTAGFGSTGFIPPLGAGDYAFWMQDTTLGTRPYGLDLVLASVPEPGTFVMMLAGLTAFLPAIRRRRAI